MALVSKVSFAVSGGQEVEVEAFTREQIIIYAAAGIGGALLLLCLCFGWSKVLFPYIFLYTILYYIRCYTVHFSLHHTLLHTLLHSFYAQHWQHTRTHSQQHSIVTVILCLYWSTGVLIFFFWSGPAGVCVLLLPRLRRQ